MVSDEALQFIRQHCAQAPAAHPADRSTRAAGLARLLRTGDNQIHPYLRGGRAPDAQQLYNMAFRLLERLDDPGAFRSRTLTSSGPKVKFMSDRTGEMFDNDEVSIRLTQLTLPPWAAVVGSP